MTAEMIPFPAARRVDLVRSVVRRALELPPHAGEQHITRSLDLQAIVMRRKGIAEGLIAKERIGLESAIRQGIWSVVMRPRGAR
ncbi:hypothetical protein IVB02_21320 [Bradyrhizobium sp. 166]|uniref:DUF6074 family protein n=1 Tax=Bradyrhizobium sp. 166 TaxID=2782638 RepID=UPI001FF9865F|nr:DUF6074 family protein [Bradyrhizobium sp. 166]MCK1603907.1 hypothetical protein [Bradyrhizobium sp. 166]